MAEQDDNVMDAALLARWVEALTPVPPPAALRARVLARARGEHPDPYRTVRAEAGWVPYVPGIDMKMLYRDVGSGARTLLARLQPGVIMPQHEHIGAEECYVIEGEITYGDLTIRAGDFHLAPEGSAHCPMTTRTGALVLLRVKLGQHVPEARLL
jgi:anti-sigma factor ChrR (cupin superfamily)